MHTISDRIVATIKTLVPALWGLALANLIAKIPAIGAVLGWIAEETGTDINKVIEWLLTGAVIAAFYWVASKIGARFPAVQRWLLGSSLTPVYGPEIIVDPDLGPRFATRAEAKAFRDSIEGGGGVNS